MSDLLRQTVDGAGQSPRSRPDPIKVIDVDEHSSSDSSASSADSSASINTIRPGSREQAAPPTHWTSYFARELQLTHKDENLRAEYVVYITLPSNAEKGPLFICHHGAGSTAMSFAIFTREIVTKMPEAGVLCLNARGHGSRVVDENDEEIIDYSLQTLASDAVKMIELTKTKLGWSTLPPSILVGHSLGGAIVSQLAAEYALGNSLVGFCVIDVVEGSAVEALGHMQSYLSSRPSMFESVDGAVTWHLRSRTLRDRESAEASVPALLSPTNSGKYVWKTDLQRTVAWWNDWFGGMSQKFLRGRGAKLLILAGTDRLDKDLMIGQMQGKFQLVVIPEAGHFVQEDVPVRTAQLLIEFFKRNDRSGLVLPPKVSDLLAQGKKV